MKKHNEVRLIKKYQNRRLYDTATSTYIILEDIKQILVDGEMIQVVDVKSNLDVTRSVLLQIILEEEINGVPIFSNEFLLQIIRFYGKSFQPSISPFLEHGINFIRKMQKNFYAQIKEPYNKNNLNSNFELWQEFIKQQAPQIESGIKDYIQNTTDTFLNIQDNMQQQAEKVIKYMNIPFNLNNSTKKK
ncbi:MAG: polyhydroxyalkanoate synthesis repressor PhaR [Pseudomonadota bacterium]|jgi:polyhydroxyalkanoate synthesis repressor PhaR|nr:polyhydroxyalkanoate synthesis repressor PhaR [Burkholderiales bacterium]